MPGDVGGPWRGQGANRRGHLLAELRALTDGFEPPPDGCASYRQLYAALSELDTDTHLHVHKENNLLFPAVLAAEGKLARHSM